MASIDPVHLVGVGGILGAVLRYEVARRLRHERFPVGTFVVNVVGSFVLGLVVFLDAGTGMVFFLGTGVCGAFTTFSSFSLETVRLWENGDRAPAVGNATLTLLTAGAAIGLALAVATFVG